VRRLNIGGKLLTNYLKELVSYRQWNMMDEYLLMNQVTCSVIRSRLELSAELTNNMSLCFVGEGEFVLRLTELSTRTAGRQDADQAGS